MQPQKTNFLLLLLLLLALTVAVVHGIEFKNQEHSNYGDQKDNKEHIRQHLKQLSKEGDDLPQDLKEEDMIYYLFLIHDINNDGFLDGHELRQAFTDFGDDHEDATKILNLDEVTEMIDHVLEEDDLDGDGLISWSEYLESQSYHASNYL